ncbi:hypothetical protein HY621_00730 [Candidatus Uhrbacteria bacterium]|nr:hypothetical protein [Candidatus Uhrbacteria bacterium]
MLDKKLLSQNIIQLLGLQSLPEDRQVAIVTKMVELVEKRILVRILDAIKESEKDEANRIFTSGTDDEKASFIQSHANLTQLIEEEVVKIKQELLDEAAKVTA